MKHSVVFIMIFLSCVFLSAQEALQHLSPKQTSEIQKKVSGFKCPEGANRACKSFRELVESGDSATLTCFLPLIIPQKAVLAPAIYVVFDDDGDIFWIISSWGYVININDGVKVDILYSMFQHGINKTAVLDTIPFVKGDVIKMSKEGVAVSFDGDTLVFSESYETVSGSSIATKTTVKLSTLRTETVWKNGNDTRTVFTRAVGFSND